MELPGLVALFGSGETSPKGGQAFDALAKSLPVPLKIGVLETPAGFELNSPLVAGRVADFLQTRLQNYQPEITVLPARKKGTAFSPDDAEIVRPLLESSLIFLGPGSPSYAVRQLEHSLAWHTLTARQRLGACVAMASAATIAAGAHALPVYEIYKVGEDPHWKPGLSFFAPFGLDLVFVPHWDNVEGGKDLDTSRCFMGRARFDPLLEMLPAGQTVVGIDEQTVLVFDFGRKHCRVMGRSAVHMLRDGAWRDYPHATSFPIDDLGPFRLPEAGEGIPTAVWEAVRNHGEQARVEAETPLPIPADVQADVARRQDARTRRDWSLADDLRRRIEVRGWRVIDTPDGPQVQQIK